MVTKHDSTTMLPRRKLTTYAKTSRKRQYKTPYQSTAIDDDSTPKPTTKATTTTRRQFAPASSPTLRSPSPESGNLFRTGKRTIGETMAQKDLKLDRKRKFSQVSSKAQTEKPTRSQQDSSPSAPAVSDPTPSSRPSSTRRPRMRSASSEDADIDMVEARLSSPPPTPTRSKMPVATIRATSKAGMPFSPNTMQIWDNLLDSEDESMKETKQRHQQIPVRLAPRANTESRPQAPPSRVAGANRQHESKPRNSASGTVFQSKRRRRRLIDALVEQAAGNTDEVDAMASDGSVELNQPLSSRTSSTPNHNPVSVSSTLGSQPTTIQTKGNLFARPAFTPKPHALARTYGQGTKVLQEDEGDMLFEAFDLPESASHSLKGKRLELRGPRKWPDASGLVDAEVALAGSSPNTKIRDIHELRQAGASTRVADEMQDLAEQIGIPASKSSSSRRAALLRIAEEIKNKDFIRQFRDHGIDAAVFKDVGRETDVISAYLILSILVTMLCKWPSPHTIRLLQEEEIGRVFARLLRCHDNMKKVVQDRKNNLSRRSQNAVLDVQKYLRELPIWGSEKPTVISPRSLSIKCLHLLVTQESRLGRDNTIFSESVTEALLAILSEATEDAEHLDYPESDGCNDLCNTLSVLDFHAGDIASSDGENGRRCNHFLPIVADVFGAFLRSPPQKDKSLETSILKLTINLTNNNLDAPDICISKGLVPPLAGSICSNFSQVLTSTSQDHWPAGILDGLVLRLGILINFLEHSVRVRQVTYECQYEGFQPIDEFIRIFLENYRRTAEADSVEKSQLNVVFGYLAVLLGHLCLYAPMRHKFRSSHAAKSMGPLLESIREFVHHHKTMESQLYEGEDGPHGQSGCAEIEALARQLEDEAAYD